MTLEETEALIKAAITIPELPPKPPEPGPITAPAAPKAKKTKPGKHIAEQFELPL